MIYLLSLFVFIIVILLIMVFRTFQVGKKYPTYSPINLKEVDGQKIANHLSEAIQYQTISTKKMEPGEYDVFINYHEWLKKTYPLAHSVFKKEIINNYSLLYVWKGKDSSLKPVLFTSHLDVVPVDQATSDQWSVDPFRGEIKDGFVWGRGTLDMKNHTIAFFDAVESLLKNGFQLKRDIYIALGHDEEVSGLKGAKEIAASLEKKGIKFSAVLDEGGMVNKDIIPGDKGPLALIAIGEKSYITINLKATGIPGHSSNPPRQTAIGIISRAIALIDDNRFPARLDFIIEPLKRIAYMFPFSQRFIIANAWLFKSAIIRSLEKIKQTRPLIRTTHAATVIRGGIKENVLPSEALAKVNLRVLPGQTQTSVLEHLQNAIQDPRVKLEINQPEAWTLSKASQTNTPAYNTLELVVRQVFSDTPVVPYILPAATDARHFQHLSDQVYHFSPVLLSSEDYSRMHGIDERISIENLVKMVQFYDRMITIWGEAEF